MNITGINAKNTMIDNMTMMKKEDVVSKNIKKQIANAHKQMQELSANKDMSVEEKVKRREELQTQINDLNMQLRQHQIEQRKEKYIEKNHSIDNMNSGTKKTTRKEGKQSSGLSQASMKAMISADSAIKKAKVQSSVGIKLEGRAGILESEIKLDGARGACVEAKKEELTDINQKIEATKTASINTLNAANKELEDTAKSYRESEKIENKDKNNETVSNEKNDKTKNTTEKSNFITADASSENIVIDIEEDVQAMPEATIYGHVDVCV